MKFVIHFLLFPSLFTDTLFSPQSPSSPRDKKKKNCGGGGGGVAAQEGRGEEEETRRFPKDEKENKTKSGYRLRAPMKNFLGCYYR